jgi:multiple sugar transport system permease protein
MKHSQAKGWGLLSPTVIILVVMGMIPFFYVIYYSVLKYSVFAKPGHNLKFIGLNNFRKLVFDAEFMAAVGRGIIFVVSTCTLELILGMGLAILLTTHFWEKGLSERS